MKPSFLAGIVLLLNGILLGTAEEAWPDRDWVRAAPNEVALDKAHLEQARDYALTAGGSGYITRHGKLILSWGDPTKRYDLKSTTKSFGSIALALAIKESKVRLADKAIRHHPTLGIPPESNADEGWINEITLLHLASQTAGFEKPGGHTRLLFKPGSQWDYSDSGPNWLAECLTLVWKRDLDELMFERVFSPLGIRRDDLTWRKNSYRPALINGLPRREFGAGISANVDAMARIGLLMLRGGRWKETEIIPRDFVNAVRVPNPSFTHLTVHSNSLKDAGPNAPRHYSLLWWNNADNTLTNVPRDAFWSWGLYDSLIVVIPSLDLVAARAGQSWKRTSPNHYEVLRPFFEPIVAATRPSGKSTRDGSQSSRSEKQISNSNHEDRPIPLGTDVELRDVATANRLPLTARHERGEGRGEGNSKQKRPSSPRLRGRSISQMHGPMHFGAAKARPSPPSAVGEGEKAGRLLQPFLNSTAVIPLGGANLKRSSPVIEEIIWAPRETIRRAAKGSDNWPLTWADDDALYTAYGDGNGFEPFLNEKLSLGLAKVLGGPEDFIGVNLPAPTLIQKGDGRSGKKASGLLMVNGILYLWARNATNSQLAWSTNRGATWSWGLWKFAESFGCPTFLNYGQDYRDALDEFVYIYSPDANDAYTPANRMVLARVPKSKIIERGAYEFFVQQNPDGTVEWTREVSRRGAVFDNPGQCYRSSVSWCAPLKRFLWVQVLPDASSRDASGKVDARFIGGLAVLDSAKPWGPWTTAYYTNRWDVGPGDTASFPTKWMSNDGGTAHLVFSGEDHFSVRKATLVLRKPD